MAGRRVTLQTIADAVGVSRTTVSNAYNRPDQLAPALRELILGRARELGYAGPDPAARRLRSGRRDAFGLLFTETLEYAMTDPAAILFLQGFARASEEAGVSLLLVPAPPSGDVNRLVRDAVVDGFCIYSMSDDHPAVEAVLDRRVPTVVVDEPRIAGQPFVGIDDRAGARAAAAHLAALGHRRFAALTDRLRPDDYDGLVGPERLASASFRIFRERLEGWHTGLHDAGIELGDVPILETSVNAVAAGRAMAATLLRADRRPTALLCASDQLALGALHGIRDAGLRVPEDVSVVGFDDAPAAALAAPPLTTIRQPLLRKGEEAGRLLVAPPERPTEVLLPVELVVRASTGAPPR